MDALADDRDRLVEHLERDDIHCRPFWYPIHTQRPYLAPPNAFPVAMAVGPKALWLPSALSTADDDVATVAERIRDFYERRRA